MHIVCSSVLLFGVLSNYFGGIYMSQQQPVLEPDYHHLIYGSVWRHIIFSPHDSPEILRAKEYLRHILKMHFPELTFAADYLRCTSHDVLWITTTDKSPLVFDSYIHDKEGKEHPVSVPVSLGSTFNLLMTIHMNNTSTLHAFTITKTNDDIFYLYSHIFYSVSNHRFNQHTQCICNCEVAKNNSHLILSTLALSKHSQLHSDSSCILYAEPSPFQNLHTNRLNLSNQDVKKPAQLNSFKINETEKRVTKISVMTYNIWNFNVYQKSSLDQSQYAERLARISQLLHQTQPDIAGFQEVRFEHASGGKLGPNQVEHLVSALPGYQFVFQPAQLFPESFQQGRTEEGVAIFSKYPIIHHDYLLLFRNRRNSADQHQRICLHAVIHIPFIGKVHVFNTHLSLSHEAREESVTQILQYMKEVGEDGPALLLGDLNASPEEKAIRMLSEHSNFMDLWDILYPSSKGFTFNNLDDKLSKRIDYIFLKKPNNLTVLKMEVISDKTKSKVSSDHRPVVATLGFLN